jgi:hypothetical protein
MNLTINESMTITEIAAGLMLVALVSWQAAMLVLILAAVIINEAMGGYWAPIQQGH